MRSPWIVRSLAAFEVFQGLIGLWVLYVVFAASRPQGLALIVVSSGLGVLFALALLVIFAGIQLWRLRPMGIYLSLWLQGFQIVTIQTPWFALGFYIGLHFKLGLGALGFSVQFNIVALILFCLMWRFAGRARNRQPLVADSADESERENAADV